VLASAGYPGPVKGGVPIDIDKDVSPDVQLFHAGTALHEGRLVTQGGRVLAVTATADSVDAAREKAYRAVEGVRFEGMQFRRDIAS
jgi:phosphoribosylamine-glycine ligase